MVADGYDRTHPNSSEAPDGLPLSVPRTSVPDMLDHLALQCADVDAAAAFYVRVFAACGVREAMRMEHPEGLVVGLSGPDGFPKLWFGPMGGPGNRPVHLALAAPSREVVAAVFAAAQEAGAEI